MLTNEGVTGSTATANAGYKFDGWYVGDKKIEGAEEELTADLAAANVNKNGNIYVDTTFTAKFVPDEEQTKEVLYTVRHMVGDEVRDTQDYTEEVWINDPDEITIQEGSLAQKTYEGYRYDSIDNQAKEGESIASGTVITLTYVAEEEPTPPAPTPNPPTPIPDPTPADDGTPTAPTPAAPTVGDTTPAPATTPAAPATTTGRRATVTPIAPAQIILPDAPTPQAEPEQAPVEIDNEPAPQAAPAGAWALINLLATIATAALCVFLLIRFIGKRKEEQEEADDAEATGTDEGEEEARRIRRKGALRLTSIIPAVAAVIAFIVTEDMSQPMQMVDKFTILMIIILIVQIVLAALAKVKKDKEDDDEEEQNATA